MDADTVDSILGEALAYAEQCVVCLEEEDRENAEIMYTTAKNLVHEAERAEDIKKHELYSIATQTLNKLEVNFSATEPTVSKKITVPLLQTSSMSKNEGEIPKKSDLSDVSENSLDAELLYWLPEGVQLVIIENGVTATPSAPTSLAIFVVQQPEKTDALYPSLQAAGNPQAIIQVGPWVYPLNRDNTAIMKNELGIYVVPNPTNDHPDMFAGIILPRKIEKHLEEEFVFCLEKFANIRTSTVVEEMSQEQKNRTSDRIAAFLVRSGQRLAVGVKSVADKSGDFLNQQGNKYRSKLTPTEKPVNVNPALRFGVLMVYKGSKRFAKVTRFVHKVGEVGVNIGTRMARSMSSGNDGGGMLGQTATVLGGGITSMSVVWISLEDASRQLFRSIADETVETVRVRYGDNASETTYHALHAGGHTTLSAFQLWDLGPRSIAGRVARKAGIQFVQGINTKNNVSGGIQPTTTLNNEKPKKKT